MSEKTREERQEASRRQDTHRKQIDALKQEIQNERYVNRALRLELRALHFLRYTARTQIATEVAAAMHTGDNLLNMARINVAATQIPVLIADTAVLQADVLLKRLAEKPEEDQ